MTNIKYCVVAYRFNNNYKITFVLEKLPEFIINKFYF